MEIGPVMEATEEPLLLLDDSKLKPPSIQVFRPFSEMEVFRPFNEMEVFSPFNEIEVLSPFNDVELLWAEDKPGTGGGTEGDAVGPRASRAKRILVSSFNSYDSYCTKEFVQSPQIKTKREKRGK